MKLNKVLVMGIVGILLVCLFTFKKDNKQEEYVLKDRILGYFIYGVLLLIVVFFVAKTNVVFEHKHKNDSKSSKK